MNKKFAIVLALSLIAIVCCAGCIDPQDQVDPVDPVVPVDPVDPVTPPVEPVVPAEEYSVFFMLNYGEAGAYSAETVTAGDAVAKPANPTRSGYTFKGWFTAAEGGAEYDFTQAVNADLTLYAQWSKKSSSGSGHSHSYTATVVNPTCGKQGYTKYTCSCGATKANDNFVAATGKHTLTSSDDDTATTFTCSVCGFSETVTTDVNKDVVLVGGETYDSLNEAIDAAPEGTEIILLATSETNGVPSSVKVDKDIVINCNDQEVELVYDNVDSIQIKSEGYDDEKVTVTIKEDGKVDKDAILESSSEGELLEVIATVNTAAGVGDAYTGSGLAALASIINEGMAAPAEDAPTEHVQDGWDIMFYEPAPTALGNEEDAGDDTTDKSGWTITLMNDIDLTGVTWIPIGTDTNPFFGTIDTVDGKERKITGLKLETVNKVAGYGFIGVADKGKGDVTVKNLNFVDVSILPGDESSEVGAVIGILPSGSTNDLTLENVKVSGRVSAYKHVGGLVGKSYTTGAVTITNCENSAAVTGGSGGHAGGLVAIISKNPASVTIDRCKNYGDVELNGGTSVGGLIGDLSAETATITIKNSINYGEVSGGMKSASGIANIGTVKNVVIENIENNGDISATSTDQPTGGLFGSITTNLSVSGMLKNSGDINGNKVAGGIFGQIAKADTIPFTSVQFVNTKFVNTGNVSVEYDDDNANGREGAGAIFALLYKDGAKFDICEFKNAGKITAPSGNYAGLIAAKVTTGTMTFNGCTYVNSGSISNKTEVIVNVGTYGPSTGSLVQQWIKSSVFGYFIGEFTISDGTQTTKPGYIDAPLATALAGDGTLFVMFNAGEENNWIEDKMVVEYKGKNYTISRELDETISGYHHYNYEVISA